MGQLGTAGQTSFYGVKDHVLLPYASELDEVDAHFKTILSPQLIQRIVALVPDEWLVDESTTMSPQERRQVYAQFLETRVAASELFVKEAQNARKTLI